MQNRSMYLKEQNDNVNKSFNKLKLLNNFRKLMMLKFIVSKL